MKAKQKSVKKIIKKRIELKKTTKNMGVRDKDRASAKPPIRVQVGLVSRNEIRTGRKRKPKPKIYHKKLIVDYDIVICIPSHERYQKVRRLISQFYEQETKYSFKIILLNDGSNDKSYDKLIDEFSEIIYLKNDKPNGKFLHWYCYNQMWKFLKDIECHAVLQMDDDFILCDNFLDTITDIYFEQKNIDDNMRGISPHTWSFINKKIDNEGWWNNNVFVDGISLLDIEVIKSINYQMQPVDEIVKNAGVPVRAWTQINENVNRLGGYYYRTPESLVYHDGNNDSKLHGDVRINGKGVFTQKLCDSLKKYENYE